MKNKKYVINIDMVYSIDITVSGISAKSLPKAKQKAWELFLKKKAKAHKKCFRITGYQQQH